MATYNLPISTALSGEYQLSDPTYSQTLGAITALIDNDGGEPNLTHRPVFTFTTANFPAYDSIDSATISFTLVGATGTIVILQFNRFYSGTNVNASDNAATISTKWNTSDDVANDIILSSNVTAGSYTDSINSTGLTEIRSKVSDGDPLSILIFPKTGYTPPIERTISAVSLTVTYTPLSLQTPTNSDIVVAQSSESSTISRTDGEPTTISVSTAAKAGITGHAETHYQIWLVSQPVSGTPHIDIKSGKLGLNNNGTLKELSKDQLKIILKFSTNYKMRIRMRGSAGWSSWSNIKTFKTRDKDHKRG